MSTSKKINKIELAFLIIGFITFLLLGFFTAYSLNMLKDNFLKAFSSDFSKKSLNFDIEGYNKLGL